MSDLQSKTDEELNVMLAQLAGHKIDAPPWVGIRENGMRYRLPDYCSSLDEVAKVEAGLTDEQHNRFRHNLRVITSGADIKFMAFRELISATARQRTLALIQTLQQ